MGWQSQSQLFAVHAVLLGSTLPQQAAGEVAADATASVSVAIHAPLLPLRLLPQPHVPGAALQGCLH